MWKCKVGAVDEISLRLLEVSNESNKENHQVGHVGSARSIKSWLLAVDQTGGKVQGEGSLSVAMVAEFNEFTVCPHEVVLSLAEDLQVSLVGSSSKWSGESHGGDSVSDGESGVADIRVRVLNDSVLETWRLNQEVGNHIVSDSNDFTIFHSSVLGNTETDPSLLLQREGEGDGITRHSVGEEESSVSSILRDQESGLAENGS